ncbi:PREDICTED: uncharacterized protein LOC104576475 [Tinamus guttatus]|uniref:uncharacterized protein LOC104576475 n=1 Tax=Tinamus guttatus TaxID=94827 RepID=UPI00052EDD85|nr:PREDICTED: uncharacterized protein LOC104576475 [Tinamus guttatus]
MVAALGPTGLTWRAAAQVRTELERRTGHSLAQHKDFIDNEMLLVLAQMDRPSRIFPHLYLVGTAGRRARQGVAHGHSLAQHKDFIDNEMLLVLAQMDRPSRIFPHLYLGSEWNAANLEELQQNRVTHILNVAREIDNFFPALFTYMNVRVYDEDTAQLLPHWNDTFLFLSDVRRQRSSQQDAGTAGLLPCMAWPPRICTAPTTPTQGIPVGPRQRRQCCKPTRPPISTPATSP